MAVIYEILNGGFAFHDLKALRSYTIYILVFRINISELVACRRGERTLRSDFSRAKIEREPAANLPDGMRCAPILAELK